MAKVTFKVIGIGTVCATFQQNFLLLVFHFNYVSLVPFPWYYQLFPKI